MIYKLVPRHLHFIPDKRPWAPEKYRYFCEVVFRGDLYTVEINQSQYSDFKEYINFETLDFLVITNWFSTTLYCISGEYHSS